MTLDKEARRLSRAFRRAMLVAIAGAGACATQSPELVASKDGGREGGAVEGDAATVVAPPDATPDAACEGVPFVPDPPDTCGDYVRFPCGLPEGIAPRGDCFFPLGACSSICPAVQFNCRAIEAYCLDGGVIVPDEAGAVIVDCSRCAGSVGRVPEGLERRDAVRERSSLGAHFAEAAHLEAASVFAFRVFARELSAHGAPPELVQAARRAETDEVRHARAVGRLARRFGGRYVRPRVRPSKVRPLEAVARDNAVEGCVRETFGALVATWQAQHAGDSEVASTLEVIAEDETRHAALSWAALRWSFAELDAEARSRVVEACAVAIDEVIGDERDDPDLVAVAGLPPRRVRQRFAASLRDDVWSVFFDASRFDACERMG